LAYTLPSLNGILARASGGTGELTLNTVRLATAFGVLIVPTTAMGATLPVLVGALARTGDGFGRTFGWLYGWNTLGAVAGRLVAETELVARVGIAGSAWIAALLDLLATTAAIVFARRNAGASSGAQQSVRTTAGDSEGPTSSAAAILIAAFGAGAALLALEVVWIRFLSMYVLTTTMAMSLMLAVVLAAIGAGGVAASRWLTRGDAGAGVEAAARGRLAWSPPHAPRPAVPLP